MKSEKYLKRIIEKTIIEYLDDCSAIYISGPRDCGKTTTCKKYANSKITLNDYDEESIKLLSKEAVLNDKYPRLIDEWQLRPVIYNWVKNRVDDLGTEKGMYILSGSADPKYDITLHSGAGRIIPINMRTMTFCELGLSSNEVSFVDLLSKKKISGSHKFTELEYSEYVCKGGWPRYINTDIDKTIEYVDKYIDTIIKHDIRTLDISKPDPKRMMALVSAISRNIGTQVSNEKLARESDISAESEKMKRTTVRHYLDQLMMTNILEELQVWKTHARDSIRLLEKPKLYFIDSSIAVARLGLNHKSILLDPKLYGFIFECAVIKSLRVYAEASNAKVGFYKESNGLDIDAIIEFRNGSWMAFEIKKSDVIGVKEAVDNFNTFKNQIKPGKWGKLISLNIITGGSQSYTREDDINVIAFGHLCFNK